MITFNLKVGQYYKSKDGEVFQIVTKNDDGNYVGDNGLVYSYMGLKVDGSLDDLQDVIGHATSEEHLVPFEIKEGKFYISSECVVFKITAKLSIKDRKGVYIQDIYKGESSRGEVYFHKTGEVFTFNSSSTSGKNNLLFEVLIYNFDTGEGF